MRTIIILILAIFPIVSLQAYAGEANHAVAASCDAEISIILKTPTQEIKTNDPIIAIIQIKNTSTNETLLFRIENVPTDFTWNIISPSYKDVSPTNQLSLGGSGWMPKIMPLQSTEVDFDLRSICSFTEIGSYKVIVEKEVFFISPERKKCEIISNPLNITISK